VATAEVGGPINDRAGLLPVRRVRGLGQLLRQHGNEADHPAGFFRCRPERQDAPAVRRHVPRLRGQPDRRLEPSDPGSHRQRHLHHRYGQPLDTDGDGKISHQEYFAVGSPGLSPFLPFDSIDPAAALENTGTTTLDESNVLVDPNDKLDNETLILYVDLDYDFDNGWKITNQFYYETLDNINENAYGFSQFGDVTAIEDKLVFAYNRDFGGMQADIQLSPSIRYTDFTRGQDFINEFFDRRDLSQSNAERDPSLDTRLLSTQINDDYSEWQTGDYTIYGLAALGSFTFDNGLIATLGFRNDVHRGRYGHGP
jgi:hypothetical protein